MLGDQVTRMSHFFVRLGRLDVDSLEAVRARGDRAIGFDVVIDFRPGALREINTIYP